MGKYQTFQWKPTPIDFQRLARTSKPNVQASNPNIPIYESSHAWKSHRALSSGGTPVWIKNWTISIIHFPLKSVLKHPGISGIFHYVRVLTSKPLFCTEANSFGRLRGHQCFRHFSSLTSKGTISGERLFAYNISRNLHVRNLKDFFHIVTDTINNLLFQQYWYLLLLTIYQQIANTVKKGCHT